MKALVCPRYGGPEVLQLRDVERPEPAADEVLVRVHAAGLNAADWHIMRADPFIVRVGNGLLRPRMRALGADLAGTVETVGDTVRELRVGDEVFADLSTCGFGAFAEYVCVPERFLSRKPSTTFFEQAAVMPLSGVTALQALRDQAAVTAGERVLVYGASGGVGTYAVQLAVAMGAEVTAVCSSSKTEQVHALGAHRVVDYLMSDVFADGQSWDVVLGVNGYQPVRRYRDALRPGGRYLMIGGTGRQMLEGIALGKALSTRGRSLGPVIAKPDGEKLADLRRYVEAGQVRALIDRRYPLEEGAEAMRYLEEGHSHGKIVLSVMEPEH
ncbi:MAG: NAD(P)-dependent alcohol dehydrogenase [Ornithinimicrobium sp.]